MTLYLIGLGLFDEKDISVRGLEIVQNCDIVYLEHYTSILGVDKDTLSKFYGKEVLVAPRDVVEKQAQELLIEIAKDQDVALLVVGDVFGATTHTDLMLRAKESGVKVEVVFNASIMNAIGVTGLELYKFGKTTSIVFPEKGWLPQSPYDVIKANQTQGLHTLCLLDIKVAEPSREDLLREHGITPPKPRPPRFMSVNEGLDVLNQLEKKVNENIITPETIVVGVARLGHPDQKIVSGSLQELLHVDFGKPLHCIIIPGKLHHIEVEALATLKP